MNDPVGGWKDPFEELTEAYLAFFRKRRLSPCDPTDDDLERRVVEYLNGCQESLEGLADGAMTKMVGYFKRTFFWRLHGRDQSKELIEYAERLREGCLLYTSPSPRD